MFVNLSISILKAWIVRDFGRDDDDAILEA
jgi:hypothetical protein